MRYTLPVQPYQPTIPTPEVTPESVRKYLAEAGWTEQQNYDKNYYRHYGDPAITGYFTWEQAIAWSLVKPFLGN